MTRSLLLAIKNVRPICPDEADVKDNLIYFRSPIGKGLIGKSLGDLATIVTPSGEKNFEILSVDYI